MKKVAFVFAALVIGAGAAVAKDAKAPKAMSDSEMEKVVAGDPGKGNATGWDGYKENGSGNTVNGNAFGVVGKY